jgi:hypothetical protein
MHSLASRAKRNDPAWGFDGMGRIAIGLGRRFPLKPLSYLEVMDVFLTHEACVERSGFRRFST